MASRPRIRSSDTPRTRPAKPPLSRAAIVDAALDLVGELGVAAVTMRKVADALDTAAASLYVYVADRRDLMAGAYDRALADVPLPTGGSWRRQLERLVTDQVAVLGAHGDIAAVALGEPQLGPHALLITERVLGLLRTAGVPDSSCIAAADLLDQYAVSASLELAQRLRDRRRAESATARPVTDASLTAEAAARLQTAYAGLPAEDFPAIAALRDGLADTDPAERARWKLAAIIDGILAQRGHAHRRR